MGFRKRLNPPPRCARTLPHRGRDWSTLALSAIVASVLAISTTAHAAGNAKNGRQKALQCQTCHGLDGLSKLPEAPHIAGQPEPYLIKSMTDFKNGTRQNDMMTFVAKELSDQDIADLAAYYASIELSVTVPKR
ncbi:cytochrome c553 [Variibacter gotjawalensis]|nr:cytochrome c553 [Variibacter gotjawalensis]